MIVYVADIHLIQAQSNRRLGQQVTEIIDNMME